MKKYIVISTIIVSLYACKNGKRGNGNIISETRTVAAFTKINAATSIEVDVQQGPQTSVIVEADDNLIQYVETNVESGELKLRIKNISIWNDANIKVHIITPQIDGIKASSSAEIVSNNTLTNTNKISLDASSSADIDVQLNAPIITIEASSSATITASGRTKEVKVDASSSADINVDKLQAEIATAEASSSADITIFGSIKIIAKAKSSGAITYTGGAPEVIKTENSSGSVSKK